MMRNFKPMLGTLLGLLFVLISGPVAARFVSVDPVQANPNNGANFNRYLYANNNPYKFTDPDGRQSREFNWENRRLGVKPPPVSENDWLHKPLGYALGGVIAAPAIGFAGSAAIANPTTATSIATTFADMGMGDALGGASLTAGGAALFRVVDSAEMQSVSDVGKFLPTPNGDEVKRFISNLPDAKALASQFSRFFGGEQHIVQGVAPQSVMDTAMRTPLSDIPGRQIESIAIPNEQLPKIQCIGRIDGC